MTIPLEAVSARTSEDFHTRLLNEHWSARHEETKQDLQRKIELILKGRKR